MVKLFVTDTNSIISCFSEVFNQTPILSIRGRSIIKQALYNPGSEVRLSIPSVVFIEIFEKWFTTEEFAAKFHYEVLTKINESPNIEIKPIEREVLDNLLRIGGALTQHEINDKLVLASAMMLDCPLITTDQAIKSYVRDSRVIPGVID